MNGSRLSRPGLPAIRLRPLYTVFLAAGLSLPVYLATLAPTVFSLDSAELTTAAFSLGLAHAPGYPVYLLLAHLFTCLPVGDVGYRVNLLSALANVGTVTLLVLLVHRLTGHSLPALVAGLSYAFCFYSWSVSVVAEVYTVQGLLLTGVLLALLDWRDSGNVRQLLVAVGLAGLALSNNPATGLWWPGLLLLMWTAPWRSRLAAVDYGKVVAVFLLALTPVLYLPLRSATQPALVQVGHFDAVGVFHSTDLTRIGNLLWYLGGRQFGSLMWGYSPAEYGVQLLGFLHWLWAAYLGIGLPLGLWGIWSLAQRNRAVLVALLLAALPQVLFFTGYRAVDKDTMLLPVFLLWAVLLGVGVDRVLANLPEWAEAVGLLLPAALLLVNLPYVNVRDFRVPHDRARHRLEQADDGAFYLATWGDAELMRYHQIVAGLRPDVTVVNVFFIASESLAALVQHQLDKGTPVYSNYRPPALGERFEFVEIGEGYQVLFKGETP